MSIIYLTCDSERILARSLQSVEGIGQEILIVDSGSKDATLTIARSFGVRVLCHPWEGFARQRQWAVEQAAHDWILMMDSDELLTSCVRREIRKLMTDGNIHAAAYRLRRYSMFGDRRIYFGDWRHDEVIRLFDRRRGHYDLAEAVHESWHSDGASARIPCLALEHHSYASFAQLLEKTQYYADLNAQKVAARGRPVPVWAPMSHALWAFFRSYVLRLGLLDGVEGGAIAWTTALGAYFKYAMAREILDREERS